METPPQQVGGVDPGLAALIAAILSGGVSAYGFSKTSDNDRAELRTAIEENLKREVGERLREEANVEVTRKEEEIRRLQGELDQLKASTEKANAAAKASAEASSDVNQTFRNAKPEALLAAIPILLSKLATRYPKIKKDGSATPTFKSALEYPASYTGRLMRMSLADFYRKRIEPSLRIDINRPATGGRRLKRRAKRGGDMEAELAAVEQETSQPMPTTAAVPGTAASYGSDYPNYEEFAPLYAESIKEAAQQLASKGIADKESKKQAAEQKKSADAAEKAKAADIKKDKAAEKAAKTLADKLLKVVKAAEKDMEKYHPKVGTNEYLILQERKVYDMLEDARIRSDIPEKKSLGYEVQSGPMEWEEATDYPEEVKAKSLRFVTTEEQWKNLMKDSQTLLEEIPKKVKDFANAIEEAKKLTTDVFTEEKSPLFQKQESEVKPLPEPAVDEVTPPSDTISRQTSVSEPASTTSVDNELAVPVFLKERKDLARKKLEEELLSETLPRIKKTKRTKFGGSRKRTLKKRRGGK